MKNDDLKTYTENASRFACHCAFASLPFLPFKYGVPIFVVGLIVGIIILSIEKPILRRNVVAIWLGGIVASIAIVLIISNWFLQIIFFIICLVIASVLIDEGVNDKGGVD